MSGETLTPLELQRAGLDALREKLGLSGMIRFIQQFESGRGDYTADRHQWLDGIEVTEIRDQLGRLRLERDPSSPPSAGD
jgi:hypothetical protein